MGSGGSEGVGGALERKNDSRSGKATEFEELRAKGKCRSSCSKSTKNSRW